MKKKFWFLLVGVIIAVVIICFVLSSHKPLVSEGSKDCVVDSDCVVFGEDGECNCGCYNKEILPSRSGGACFCAAPESCDCVDGTCEVVYSEIIPNL